MANYKVLSEQGVILEGADNTIHAKGEVIDLDPAADQTKALLENSAIEAEAAPLEPAMPFSIVVEWIDGVTLEQREAAQPMIKEAMDAMTAAHEADPASVLPEGVNSLTFKRLS